MPDEKKPNPFEGDTSPPKPPPLPADAPAGAVYRMPGSVGIYVDADGMPVKAKPVVSPTPAPTPPPAPAHSPAPQPAPATPKV